MSLHEAPAFFDKERTYYVAGPMSGIEKYNYPAFQRAVDDFRDVGLKVHSPHEPYARLSAAEHKKNSYESYIKNALLMEMRCDGIILLPGWTRSKGARRELDIALDLNYPAWFYDFDQLISMDLDFE